MLQEPVVKFSKSGASEHANQAKCWLLYVTVIVTGGLISSCGLSEDDSPDANSSEMAEAIPLDTASKPPATTPRREVELVESGGTLTVPVVINDTIKLGFVLDSGASDVQIPADVAQTMLRSGTLDRSDFLGQRTYRLADGSTLPSYIFRIRSLRVGDVVVPNVTGAIAPPDGELLLGQSFLSRLTSWSIHNGKRVLALGAVKQGGDAVPVHQVAPEAPISERNSDYGGDATALAAHFFSVGSQNDLMPIRNLYPPNVQYYGKAQGVDQILTEKRNYIRRWPVRNYVIDPNSLTSSCNEAQNCSISGTVSWSASDPASGRNASGMAEFHLIFADGLVVAEGSKVTSRD